MHRDPARGGGPSRYPGPTSPPLGPPDRTGPFLLSLLTAAALVLAAAGCGGGSGGSAANSPATTSGASAAGSGKGTTLHIKADASGALRFDKSTLTAKAGKVTIVMGNPSPLSHDIAIQGNGVDVTGATVTQGGTSTVTADLKPGTYTFLCTVDRHAAAGMKGTLTVR
jgi:plastocyanin